MKRVFVLPWPVVRFQPILYLFIWSATIRIIITEQIPIRFDLISPWIYKAWATLNVLCPLIALLALWLIRKCKWSRSTLVGIWLRLGSDIGMFLALLSFHLAGILSDADPSLVEETTVFRRYIVASCLFFCLLLVVRDILAIVAVERLSIRIRHEDE